MADNFALLMGKEDFALEQIQNTFDARFQAFPTVVEREGRTFVETVVVKLTPEELASNEKLIQEGRRVNDLAAERGVDPSEIEGHDELVNRQRRRNNDMRKKVAAIVEEQGVTVHAVDAGKPVERFTAAVTTVGDLEPGDVTSGAGQRIRFDAEEIDAVERARLVGQIEGSGRSLTKVTPAQKGEIEAGATVKEALGPEPTSEEVRKGVIAELDEPDSGPAAEERRAEVRDEKEEAARKKAEEDELARRGAPSEENEEYRRRRRRRIELRRKLGPLGFLLGTPSRPESRTVGEAEDRERARRIAAAKRGQQALTTGEAAADTAGDAAKAAKAAKTVSKAGAAAGGMGTLMRFLGPIGYGFMAYDLLSREPRRRREIRDRRLEMNAALMDDIRQRAVNKQASISGEYAAIQDLAQGLPPQSVGVRMTPELQAILGSRANEVARMGSPIAPGFTEIMAQRGRYQ